MTALPSSLSGLGLLGALSLAHNPLGGFPPVLGTLTALRELNLDHTGEWGEVTHPCWGH